MPPRSPRGQRDASHQAAVDALEYTDNSVARLVTTDKNLARALQQRLGESGTSIIVLQHSSPFDRTQPLAKRQPLGLRIQQIEDVSDGELRRRNDEII